MFKPLQVLIIVSLFLINETILAQNFLNGSFEINTSGPCNYNMANATFTSLMANTTAYGGGGELDIMGPGAGCPYGSPECGNWFIGMAYPGAPDAFTMDLSAPLIAGATYTMSFWDKGDGQYPPAMPIVIGVSTVQGASGTTVYTGPVPTINVWSQRIFTFVAPNSGQYISVETLGPTRWTHVDDFTLGTIGNMVSAGNVVGSPFCACSTFMVPFTSSGVFNPGNIYSVLLSDATGNFATATTIGTLTSTSNADSILCTIPCNAVVSNLYQIQVVSSNPVNSVSCSGAVSSVNISVGSGTAVTVNSPSICSGQTAHLVANGSNSYTWSAGINVTGINTGDATPITTTTYTVTGVSGLCSDSAVATVTVTAPFTLTVNSPNICSGQTANLTATGGTGYVWSAGPTVTGIGTADVSPVNTSTYTVTSTTGGCVDSSFATVTVTPLPIITVNSLTICPGQTANLVATGGISYLWSAGATSSGVNTADASPIVTTTYTVTGTIGSCSNTAISTVTVSAALPVTVNSPTICAGQIANLTAGGATNYIWSAGAGSTGIATANASPLVTSSYTVTGTTGVCSGTAVSVVTVLADPIAMFSAADTVSCFAMCVPFTEASTVSSGTITNWNWNFGDSQVGVTQNPPPHCYNVPGNYNVTLVVTASSGCRDTVTRNNYIHIYTMPIASFSSNPTETNLENSTISFFNQSAGQTSWLWNFGDTTSSTLLSPTHTYGYLGVFPIMLIVSNDEGCKDTVIHYITIDDNFEFYAPNSFTPNEDDLNDVFLPVGNGWDTENYQLWIFDRWGTMCFYTQDTHKGWDGRVSGGSESVASDMFVYKVQLKDLSGSLHSYIGSITIVK